MHVCMSGDAFLLGNNSIVILTHMYTHIVCNTHTYKQYTEQAYACTIHAYTRTNIYIYTWTTIFIHTYMYASFNRVVHTYISHIYTHWYEYIYIYIYIYIHTHTHIHTHIHLHTHTHKSMRTQTQTFHK